MADKKRETEIVRARAADGEEVEVAIERDFFLDRGEWIAGQAVAHIPGPDMRVLSIRGDDFVEALTGKRFIRF